MLDKESIHIDELITKYLSDNTSSEETQELEQWVLTNRQNKQHFIEMKKAWMVSGIKHAQSSKNTEKAWSAVSKQLFEEQSKGKVIPLQRKWWAAAASLALLVVSGWLLYQFITPSGNSNLFTAETTTESQRHLLDDESLVILNQQSSLTYELKDAQRIANLKGDAYFDITRDERQPFIIKTNTVEIKVLGTAFYVDARKELNETQVIVEEGKVAVSTDNSSVTLQAGDKAIYNQSSGKLIKVTNEDKNYNSLKSNVLHFDNSSLNEVAFALNRQYNIDVSLENKQLNNCKLNAVFKQKSLQSVMKVIESTLGVKVTQNGTKVLISGNCN